MDVYCYPRAGMLLRAAQHACRAMASSTTRRRPASVDPPAVTLKRTTQTAKRASAHQEGAGLTVTSAQLAPHPPHFLEPAQAAKMEPMRTKALVSCGYSAVDIMI